MKQWKGLTTCALVMYLCINLLFVLKYGLRVASTPVVLGGCVAYVLLVLIALRMTDFIQRYLRPWMIVVLMGLVLTALVILQTRIDPYSLQVDRWSAIHNFLSCLVQGDYPYAAQTHLGGYGSPFPVWQVFHLPFFYLGNVGLSFVLGVVLFVDAFRRVFGLKQALTAFVLIMISPAFLYEVMVRSDMMTLFLVCSALLLYLHDWHITFREHYIVIGILAGLMACTRFSAVIPLAVFYFSDFLKAGLRRQIIGLLAAILTFVIIFLPFVFWESEQLFFFEYNPFVLQTRQGHLSDLLILVPCFLFLSYRAQKDIAPCFLRIAWCMVLLVIVTFVHNMLLDGSWDQLFESQYDITYFNMALPFLIGAMNKGLDIRNSFWGAGNQNRSTLRLSVLLLLASCSLSLKSYSQSFKETGLPVCYITTQDSADVVSKVNYLDATMTLVQDEDTLIGPLSMQIRGRGNATWLSYPKKPYKLKFPQNVDILSNHGKHFALLANYCDKSLMRVAIGLQVSRLLEMEWTPADDFVELVLNGEHLGNYQLCETVRKNKNRIDISDSGFLLQFDRYWYKDDPFYFFTDRFRYPMIVKFPEDSVTEEKVASIKTVMDEFEQHLPSSSEEIGVGFDLESFARWYYATNLLMLIDTNYYFFKEDDSEDSKLHMGPLWDFEWSLGIGWYNGTERPNPNHIMVDSCYFEQIAKNKEFFDRVSQLHSQYGDLVYESIQKYYDYLTEKLQKSQELNFKKWEILDQRISVGGVPLGSWLAEVECDRQFFKNHYHFLDSIFTRYEMTQGIDNANSKISDKHHLTGIYTLSGQRLNINALPAKGVFIRNGRKYVK